MGANAIETILGGSDETFDALRKDYFDNRILVMNQGIDECVIEDFILFILKWNKEDKDIPVEKRKPIKLYINSGGGDSIVAMQFVNTIKYSKTPIIGIGLSLVASAAFHIYIACKERVAFKDTILLMHDGEVVIQNSTSKAKDTMRFIDEVERRTKQHVLDCTKIDEQFYDDHYDMELYLFSNEAKEYGIVDKIVGEDVDIDYIY